METLISCRVPGALGIFISDVQPSSEKAALRNPSPATAVFYISSLLPAYSRLRPNLPLNNDEMEENFIQNMYFKKHTKEQHLCGLNQIKCKRSTVHS